MPAEWCPALKTLRTREQKADEREAAQAWPLRGHQGIRRENMAHRHGPLTRRKEQLGAPEFLELCLHSMMRGDKSFLAYYKLVGLVMASESPQHGYLTKVDHPMKST